MGEGEALIASLLQGGQKGGRKRARGKEVRNGNRREGLTSKKKKTLRSHLGEKKEEFEQKRIKGARETIKALQGSNKQRTWGWGRGKDPFFNGKGRCR